jgi:purine nucleoside phosphorylase
LKETLSCNKLKSALWAAGVCIPCPDFTDIREVTVQTPFGEPSDAYVLGTLEGRKVAFLA